MVICMVVGRLTVTLRIGTLAVQNLRSMQNQASWTSIPEFSFKIERKETWKWERRQTRQNMKENMRKGLRKLAT